MGIREQLAQHVVLISRRQPSLAYYGVVFWSAWLLLSVDGYGWIIDSNISADLGFSIPVRWSFIVALVACAVFHSFIGRCARACSSVLLAGVVASVSSMVFSMTLIYRYELFILRIVMTIIIGICLAFLLIKSGIMYAQIDPQVAMLRYMLCQVFAGLIWLLVVSLPGIIGAVLYSILPLGTALLFLLENTTDNHNSNKIQNNDIKHSQIDMTMFKLLIVVLLVRVATNIQRQYVVSILGEIGLASAAALKIVLSLAIAIYALLTVRPVDHGRVCYVLMLIASASIATLPLIDGSDSLMYSLSSGLSGLTANLSFLVFTYACWKSKSNPVIVLGFGYALVFLGSTIGRQIGITLADTLSLAAINVELVTMLIAYGILFVTLIILPPNRILLLGTRSSGYQNDGARHLWCASERVGEACLALAEKGKLTNRESQVLSYLVMGYNSTYISSNLDISLNTVRVHIKNIYTKLNVHSKNDLENIIEQTLLRNEDTAEHIST